MNISADLDGISMLAVGAYLAAVVFNGNVSQLPAMLVDTKGYLEFISAAGILYGMYQWGPGAPIVPALVMGGVLAVIIKLAAQHTDVASKFEQFRTGQLDLFGLVVSLVKG